MYTSGSRSCRIEWTWPQWRNPMGEALSTMPLIHHSPHSPAACLLQQRSGTRIPWSLQLGSLPACQLQILRMWRTSRMQVPQWTCADASSGLPAVSDDSMVVPWLLSYRTFRLFTNLEVRRKALAGRVQWRFAASGVFNFRSDPVSACC